MFIGIRCHTRHIHWTWTVLRRSRSSQAHSRGPAVHAVTRGETAPAGLSCGVLSVSPKGLVSTKP